MDYTFKYAVVDSVKTVYRMRGVRTDHLAKGKMICRSFWDSEWGRVPRAYTCVGVIAKRTIISGHLGDMPISGTETVYGMWEAPWEDPWYSDRASIPVID